MDEQLIFIRTCVEKGAPIEDLGFLVKAYFDPNGIKLETPQEYFDFIYSLTNSGIFYADSLIISVLKHFNKKMIDKLTPEELNRLNDLTKDTLSKHTHLRAGQALFNELYNMRPELADSIRGTDFDPYYNNKRIPSFFEAILSEEAMATLNYNFKK